VNETVEVVISVQLALQTWAVDKAPREGVLAIMLDDLTNRHDAGVI
jgi:hypothetical protein